MSTKKTINIKLNNSHLSPYLLYMAKQLKMT
jgi:hypothetical protein